GESVTQGIINALPRPLSDAGFEMFQTDTVISPGYSGGPLVSLRGEIVGINVARYVYSDNPDQWQGLGFAIPSNDVRRVFEAMMRTGRDLVGYLGVELDYEGRGLGDAFARPVVIRRVTPGSPAENAGFKAGDLVRTFAGSPVESRAALIRRIQSAPVGQPVKVQIERDGEVLEIAPEIGEYSDYFAAQAQPGEPTDVEKVLAERTGVEVTHLNVYQRRRAGLHEAAPGVLVKGVRRDDDQRPPNEVRDMLEEGDIILGVGTVPIFSPQQLYAELLAKEPGSRFAIDVFRSGRIFRIPVVVPDSNVERTEPSTPP
ncbi:MAG TPA: PDZ domain-containing protein, partial [Longimicrobiaceae bacterium]|nr:PDZ domain-containing protein [Longimicrobiaceae bacterium]